MKKFKAILFDLDGTLLDTLQDLADSVNYALDKLGFETHRPEAFNYFIGNGAEMLVKRALPSQSQDKETIAKCLCLFRTHYKQAWRSNTKPYPGITKMLLELQNCNMPMAILSNKPDEFTKLMTADILPSIDFSIVQGSAEGVPLKPDPAAAIAISESMNIAAENFLYLGDTGTDMQTAVAAGMYPVGVLWGFRDAEELKANGAKDLLQKPSQIQDIIRCD